MIDSDELFSTLSAMRRVYPEWRFGQLVANLAVWARGARAESVWDVEDDELIAAARAHLERRGGNKP